MSKDGSQPREHHGSLPSQFKVQEFKKFKVQSPLLAQGLFLCLSQKIMSRRKRRERRNSFACRRKFRSHRNHRNHRNGGLRPWAASQLKVTQIARIAQIMLALRQAAEGIKLRWIKGQVSYQFPANCHIKIRPTATFILRKMAEIGNKFVPLQRKLV